MRGMPVEEILMHAVLALVVVLVTAMTVAVIVALWPHGEPPRVPDAPVFASVTQTLAGAPEETGPAREGKEENT